MHQTLARAALLLLSIAAAAPTPAAASVSAGYSVETVAPPEGFSELEQPRELLVDVYFGGRKVGEAYITSRPGFIKFRDPARVLALVPNLASSAALTAHLSQDLEANSNLVCSQTNTGNCGALAPQAIGVIFDEQRFRVDVFVAPAFLKIERDSNTIYLASPTAPLSLTSSVGVAVSGSSLNSPTYNIQNRTIVGFRNARIRSDSSYASQLGLIFDDLVAEVDSNRLRYSGGLFWVPGLDFTGRRRIAGIGVGTQFDTRVDRDSLSATPLIVFLGQPSRVEILIDGRLVGSGAYEAGNTILDTSGLPNGSYSLVLRMREAGGAVREERRFFVKNSQIAPVGEPIYFAYAGMLANTRPNRPISLSRSFFFQAGTARRLNNRMALDLAVLGTRDKILAEAGAWMIIKPARARAAALASTAGDKGVLLQLASAGGSRLNFNFDLRRIWSGDNKPLIPLPSYVDNFGSTPPTGAQVGNGSYTQASGSIAYRLGAGYLALTGSYRRDRGSPADYSIGPSLNWPLINKGGLQLVMQADAQKSRTVTAAFVGFRVLFTSGGLSMLSTTGLGSLRSSDGSQPSKSRAVMSLNGQWSHQREDGLQASLSAGIDRSVGSTTANANGVINSPLGSARADLLYGFEAGGGGLQYGLTFQSGVAAAGTTVKLGGRDLNDSALIASVDRAAGNASFDVLIDELPRGRVRAGSSLPIFLQAYRSYKVRLRPTTAASVSYDSGVNDVTLFPGNVVHLRWKAESQLAIFGKAVRIDGSPVSNAIVTSSQGIGQSDANGYFQIDAGPNESLSFTGKNGQPCQIPLLALKPQNNFVSLGRVVCR